MKSRVARRCATAFVGILAIVAAAGCSEVSRESAPVELIATAAQSIQIVDVADAACGDLGTINLTAMVKRADVADTRFLDVKLKSMRVTYVRTDGGRTVPASFTQSISGLVPVGGSTPLNRFFVFEVGALNQAPFASLYPQNGGIDPETGRPFVRMDVIVDIFGETLAGDDVAARVRFPLTFCAACGGCA